MASGLRRHDKTMPILNTTFARITVLALSFAITIALTGCGNDAREVKGLKSEVQLAYGEKRFTDSLSLAEKGFTLSMKANGDKHADTLYFAQAVTEAYLGLGNSRMAAQSLTRELAMRAAAGQNERSLQPRRTLAIKLAVEAGDGATADVHALAIAKDIGMGPGKDPQPVYRPESMYPPELYMRGVEGDVEVQYSLDAKGAVSNVQVLQSKPPRVLDQAAMDGFRKWRFTPMLDAQGKPVPVSNLKFTIAFRTGR